MDITYVVQRTFPEQLGGSERYIHDLARYLDKSNFARIVATGQTKNRKFLKSEVARPILTFREFPMNHLTSPLRFVIEKLGHQSLMDLFSLPYNGFLHSSSWGFFSLEMKDYLENSKIQILHVAALPTATAWLSWRVSRKMKIPLILTPFLHFNLPDFRVPWIKKILKDSSSIIAVTKTEKQKIIEFGVEESKVHVIPLGVDYMKYHNKGIETFRARNHIEEDSFVILIPRKMRKKGTFDTLKAIAHLSESFKRMSIILLDNTSKSIYDELVYYKRIITQNGVRIMDLGYVTGQNLIDAYQACDVVIEPSMVDSFGIVYLEAWACGKPVIAANSGAIQDVVIDNINGLLVKYGDWKEIEISIEKLINDPHFKRTLGEGGLSDVKNKYSIRNMVLNTEKVYNQF